MNRDEGKTCEVCHEPMPRLPDELSRNYAVRKYHKGSCAEKGRIMKRQLRRCPSVSKFKDIDLSEYVTAQQVAKDSGVTIHAVLHWLRAHNLRRRPSSFKLLRVVYVRLDVAARYAESRAARKPPGWVSVKSVIAEMDFASTMGYQLLRQLQARGEVKVETFRKVGYISPESEQRVLQVYRSSLPLPGWVPLGDTAKQADVTYNALHTWALRNSVELRYYRHYRHNHMTLHLEKKHAERYLSRVDPRRHHTRPTLKEAA